MANSNTTLKISKWKQWIPLFLCGVFILFAILLAFAFPELCKLGDTLSFVSIARNLVSGKGYIGYDGNIDTTHAPGYPVFLALFFFPGGNETIVIIAQILLSALCIYLAYKICLDLTGNWKWAALCSILYILDVTYYRYTICIMTDAMFHNILVLALYSLVQFYVFKRDNFFYAFIILINLALLFRYIIIYYVVIVCAACVIAAMRRSISCRKAIFAILLFLIILLGWSYRNYRMVGIFAYNTIQDIDSFEYNATVIKHRMDGGSFEEARKNLTAEFDNDYGERLENLSDTEITRLKGQFAGRYIRKHWMIWLRINAEGLVKQMFGPNYAMILKMWNEESNTLLYEYTMIKDMMNGVKETIGPLITLCASCFFLLMTYLLYIRGIAVAIKRKQIDVIDVFIFTICGYLAVAGASLGSSRFRVAWFGLIIIGMVLLNAGRGSKKDPAIISNIALEN